MKAKITKTDNQKIDRMWALGGLGSGGRSLRAAKEVIRMTAAWASERGRRRRPVIQARSGEGGWHTQGPGRSSWSLEQKENIWKSWEGELRPEC